MAESEADAPAVATKRSTDEHAVRRERAATLGLLAPPLLWLLLFFVIPVAFVAAYSVGGVNILPVDDAGVSLHDWQRFLQGKSIYLGLFWKSVRISLIVSLSVVLLAYPVGYFLALCVRKRKYVLLLLIIAPFLTSYLLRVLAWKVILGDRGVINSLFEWSGLRPEGDPVTWLLYSQFTVILVLAYIWVPFVALPIFVSLENLDRSVLEAASDLGASRWRTFVRVTLPLSLPGVMAAFVFVFIPTIGEFVTPLLVGGTRGYLYGNAINDLFTKGLDWQTGSVLAFFLLAVVALLMAFFGRFVQTRSVVAA
jgi:spermidine/putrescine transport system permease protein